jgi:Flp pilus assembly protein TadD
VLLASCASTSDEPLPEGSGSRPSFDPGDVAYWGGWHPVTATGDTSTQLARAWEAAARGDREKAAKRLTAALRADPDSTPLLEARAALHASLGFLRAAERDLERAVAVDSSNATAWMALGRVRTDLDLAVSAGVALRNARQLGAAGPELDLLFARAYRRAGVAPDALSYYARVLEAPGAEPLRLGVLIETASLVLEAGSGATRAEDLAFATRLVDHALTLEPESIEAWFLRGYIQEELGDDAAAAASYLRVCELDPRCREAHTNLALVRARLGDEEGSRAAARSARKLEKDQERKALLDQLAPRQGKKRP